MVDDYANHRDIQKLQEDTSRFTRSQKQTVYHSYIPLYLHVQSNLMDELQTIPRALSEYSN